MPIARAIFIVASLVRELNGITIAKSSTVARAECACRLSQAIRCAHLRATCLSFTPYIHIASRYVLFLAAVDKLLYWIAGCGQCSGNREQGHIDRVKGKAVNLLDRMANKMPATHK